MCVEERKARNMKLFQNVRKVDNTEENNILVVDIVEEVDNRILDNKMAEACSDNTVEVECYSAFLPRNMAFLFIGGFISTEIESNDLIKKYIKCTASSQL